MTEPQERHSNRLADETSPYLLQHQHNPVDWYPWGDEAFTLAKADDKPIFLSIGYSACHWCHVMAHESFEDDDTAAILKEHFISIKVDREELPDVDEQYMNAVQLLIGHGGWPLTIFMTPELLPFSGGTYFPPDDRMGMPGFKGLLLTIADLWKNERQRALDVAAELTRGLKQYAEIGGGGGEEDEPDEAMVRQAVTELAQNFDRKWGGFGAAPKFPPCGALKLLIRHVHRFPDNAIRSMITHTLDRMACGGMYDQAGGAFARYSVDDKWLVPHFEKMLYDNAQLAVVYLEAFQLMGDRFYRQVTEETLDYVLRDMRDEHGGFYAAEDADSEGVEGKFYVWSKSEFEACLDADDRDLAVRMYDVTESGNFEGTNILNRPVSPRVLAAELDMDETELEARRRTINESLMAVRADRIRPGLDDKILVAWNGLMITAFARAAQVLNDDRYRQAAVDASVFIVENLWPEDGLRHLSCKGQARFPAYLDDYTNLANAFIDVYETTFDSVWLTRADTLAEQMIQRFLDKKAGGFYFTSDEHQKLVVRSKPAFDSAVPAGNGTAVHVLLRLGRMLGKNEYTEIASAILRRHTNVISKAPRGFMTMLQAIEDMLSAPADIAIVGDPAGDDAAALIRVVHERFLPGRTIVAGNTDTPLLKDKTTTDGKAAAYVCRNFTCREPVTDAAALATMLAE